MALSRADAARRQPRPVRTEQEVAADVIMRLFDHGLLRMDANVMARVAAATGVTVDHPELVLQARRDLAGHDLACWCPLHQPCHADVLLELANAPLAPEAR